MVTQDRLIEHDTKHLIKQILAFYIPLALSAMIMMSSSSITNAALSNTDDPESALAAFSVAQSVLMLLSSINFSGMQMLVARGQDRESYKNGMQIMLLVSSVSLLSIAAVSLTPLGQWIFINILGAPVGLIKQIILASRWGLILPFIFYMAALSESIILSKRKTHVMTVSRIARIFFMLWLASSINRYGWLTGASVGAAVWILGMAFEILCNSSRAIFLFKDWGKEPDPDQGILTKRMAFDYIWPLILTSLFWGMGKPILNAGMSRMVNPERVLATYQVASNFVWIFIVLIEGPIRQLSLIFGKTSEDLKVIRRFILWISSIVIIVILCIGLTPLKQIILGNIIGASPTIVSASVGTILVFALHPLAISWQEYYMGILYKESRTRALGIGKGCNILVMALVVFGLSIFLPRLGATAGAFAVVSGMGAEMLFLRWVVRTKS